MEELKRRFLRPGRKLTDMFPIATLQAFGIMVLATIIQAIVTYFGLEYLPTVTSTDPAITFAGKYLEFIFIWPAAAICILLPPSNRPMLRDILPNHRGNTGKGILFGLLLGFGFNAGCILISALLRDVGFEFYEFNLLSLLILFASVLVQSGAEEIVTRLFLYEKLRRRYRSPWVAIILNAVLFGGLHLLNPGANVVPIAQCMLVGILFSLFVYYFDSLWAAIFFHTSWNYTQSILFGCPNSGVVSEYSLLKLTGASSGPFFDATFGVEGGVGTVVILVAMIVGVIVYARSKGLPTQDLWAERDAACLAQQTERSAACLAQQTEKDAACLAQQTERSAAHLKK